MNFSAVNFLLIMKTLCVLAVVVVVVTASPGCSSYCDKLYSGWRITRRSVCNCIPPQKPLHDGAKYKHDLLSILLPLKSHNRPPTFKDLHKNQEKYRISLTSNILSGFVNSGPNKIKHKTKRSSYDGDIPEEKSKSPSLTAKTSDEVLNNTNINEKKLADCIDLLILINIRKFKNKNFTNLEQNALEKNDHLNDLEINTEIKDKCDQASTIIQESVAEIKNHQKYISRRKNQNVNETPKIDVNSEVTDETTPMPYINEDRSTITTVKSTTPDDEPYTNKITTTDNTPILDSEIQDFNLSTTLEDNNRKETTEIYYNLNNLNYTVPGLMKDDHNSNTMDNSSINSIVNTTSTKLKNNETPTGNKSNLSYKLKNVQKNNFNDKLTSEKSLEPPTFPERLKNKSMLMTDYSDNVIESTSKTVPTETNNSNENKTSVRDSYKEKEVPIIRIITREYPNDTISSVINGTEMFTKSDFENETIINNNKTKNISDISNFKTIATESEIQSRSDDATPTTSEKQTFENTSPIINGRLYFKYGQEHIPVHFFQTSDGHLRLTLDLNTICNELIRKGKQNSLISTLCLYLH